MTLHNFVCRQTLVWVFGLFVGVPGQASAQPLVGLASGRVVPGAAPLAPKPAPVAATRAAASDASPAFAPAATPESAPALAPVSESLPLLTVPTALPALQAATVSRVDMGCLPVSDQAMAVDLAAVTAQSKKVDLNEQVRLFQEAVDVWAQAVAQCEGRARERAVRNRDDNQHMLDRLAEKLDAGPQCASAHKNAGLLQDIARQALSDRRWLEAAALFRKAEYSWDLASERCVGSQHDTAVRHREQSAQDGHNAQFCAPLFEKAREQTQKLRTVATSVSREDKHDGSLVAETLWRDAMDNCKGAAVLDIAANNAKSLARERGTPWVRRLAPGAQVVSGSPTEASRASAPLTALPEGKKQPLQAPPANSVTSVAPLLGLRDAPPTGAAVSVATGAAPTSAAATASMAAEPGALTVGDTRFVGSFLRDAGATTLSGTGKVTWATGDVFEGTLVKGSRHGRGVIVWANGQRYAGDWVHDKPTGQAAVHFVNGNDYEGQVLDGTPQGKGRMRYASGDVFEGQFLNGDPDGRGVYVWRNGQRYEGSWKSGRPNGQGKLKFATGNQYEGQVLDGLPQGLGRMVFSGGEIYEGQFRNGEPDGHGSFYWPSGDQYVGQWQAGKKHGTGVFTWKSGDRWEGVYDQDVQKTEGPNVRAGAPG